VDGPRSIGDERGFIVSWFTKLAVWFLIVAVLLFDGGSILVNFFTLDSTADEIAVQLTIDSRVGSLRVETIRPQAQALAEAAEARLVDLRIEEDLVLITLRRKADTLVVGRIGWIDQWARATAEGQAGIGPS
jgi:hypothetical protein